MSSLLNYSGLISSLILLCALLKIYIYYTQFNISIFSFIELQDAIVLFIDNLLGYLALIIPTIIYNSLIYSKSSISIKSGTYNMITIHFTMLRQRPHTHRILLKKNKKLIIYSFTVLEKNQASKLFHISNNKAS
jgi:hypothetical protein